MCHLVTAALFISSGVHHFMYTQHNTTQSSHDKIFITTSLESYPILMEIWIVPACYQEVIWVLVSCKLPHCPLQESLDSISRWGFPCTDILALPAWFHCCTRSRCLSHHSYTWSHQRGGNGSHALLLQTVLYQSHHTSNLSSHPSINSLRVFHNHRLGSQGTAHTHHIACLGSQLCRNTLLVSHNIHLCRGSHGHSLVYHKEFF